MSEAKSEVKEPWTDAEFCAELGRAWLKLFKAQTGKEYPLGMEMICKSEEGKAFLGMQYRDQVKKSDKLNIKEDYATLSFNAKCALKQKYHIEA